MIASWVVMAMAFILGILTVLEPASALALENPAHRTITALDHDRFLLTRHTDEGLILRFCGPEEHSDDPIVLLRDHIYIQDVCWFDNLGIVVVAAGKSEAPPSLLAYSPDGTLQWRRSAEDAFEGVKLRSLPTDPHLGYIPSHAGLGSPRRLHVPPEEEFPRGVARGPWQRNLLGQGTKILEWQVDHGEVHATLRDFMQTEPLWHSTISEDVPAGGLRMAGGVIGDEFAWLTWQSKFEPFPIVTVDLTSGTETSRRVIEGYGAELFPEPQGDRLLAWIDDPQHHGRMLVLLGATLAVVDTLSVPNGWFPLGSPVGRQWRSGEGVTIVPAWNSRPSRKEPEPDFELRTLVITWGEDVAVHVLPVAACLDGENQIRVWYEYFTDSTWRHIRILVWEPPIHESERANWNRRWSRMR